MYEFFLYHDQAKSFMPLRDGLTIGRIHGDVQFNEDRLISALHCRFHVVRGSIYVEDLNSTNSTQVNRVPIVSNRKRRVLLNDVIKVGSQRLIITRQVVCEPPGSQDHTVCRNVMLQQKQAPEQVAEPDSRTVVLANSELRRESPRLIVKGAPALVLESTIPEPLQKFFMAAGALAVLSFCFF